MSKKTVETIVESNNDYVIQVKGNQKTLFQEIQSVIVKQQVLDYYQESEKNHGRHSYWFVRVFNAVQNHKADEWKGLSRFIHVHKRTEYKGKTSHSDRLYISSHSSICAKYFHQGIRAHWGIENSLHWVKDVVHKEDDNQIKKQNGPVNAAVFSTIAINLHRMEGNQSITEAQIISNANFNELFNKFRT